MSFNEHALELSVMELFGEQGYTHLTGTDIHREKSAVLLEDDLRAQLRHEPVHVPAFLERHGRNLVPLHGMGEALFALQV